MDHARGGHKPSQYSAAMARLILARIEMGETVQQIAADPGMPCYATIYHWRRRHPEFAAAWREARADIALFRRRALTARADYAPVWEAARAKAEGRRARRKAGRKSTYTPERGEAYCALIADGLTSRAASARPGMPAVAMAHRWLRNHPEFRVMYLLALQIREERLWDEALMLAAEATPATAGRTEWRLKRLRARMAALRPKVWLRAT